MDRFYLQNVSLYQKLVEAFDPDALIPHFSRQEATPSTNPPTSRNTARRNTGVLVGARIRPMLEDDLAAGFPRAIYPRAGQVDEPQTVDLHDLYNHPRQRPTSKHTVDQLFDSDATTQQVYDSLVADLVSWAQEGGTATLFAHGQTGSGKTFTISEIQKLAVQSLLQDHNDDEIYITIFDLAGKSAFDLLDARKPVSVLEDSKGNTHVKGAREVRVQDGPEFLDLLDEAASYRRTASTMKNDASSRSHAVCRIRVRNVKDPDNGILYLVDLAGSEAARDVAEHGNERMKETKEINMSLSVLKDCVRGKAQADALSGTERHSKVRVPIRQTTLTKVLKHVFDPQRTIPTKTAVVACVNPSLADVNSSKNTLRYAEMMRG